MFSESVKGLLKSLTNTLVFITVVTSTIFLFPLLFRSLLVSCAVTFAGCISPSGGIAKFHQAELRY